MSDGPKIGTATTEYREAQVVALDYIKHVTALATGAVVLIASLLEKVFATPRVKILAIVAVVAFAVSVGSLVLAALGVLRSIRSHDAGGRTNVAYTASSFSAGLVLFLIGLAALTIFSIVNLL